MDTMRAAGYEQYEISNFALPRRAAVHNTNYWRGITYLGLGPSAHSYQGSTRRWNVANLNTYIHSIIEGKLPYEQEHLTLAQQANEYIMTSLRTQWGLDMRNSLLAGYLPAIEQALKSVNPLHYHRVVNQVTLTQAGKHFADTIAAHLFIVEND
jgi:oxygen-independent coproporphyrinogen-3 oxidase